MLAVLNNATLGHFARQGEAHLPQAQRRFAYQFDRELARLAGSREVPGFATALIDHRDLLENAASKLYNFGEIYTLVSGRNNTKGIILMNRSQNEMEESEFTHMLAQTASQNPEKGLELLEQALLHQPQNQRLYRLKGMFLGTFFHRYEESLKAFDQALHIDSQDQQSLYYKGQALAALKRYKEALQAYNQALDVEETGMIYYAKGKVLCQLQHYLEISYAALPK